MDVTLLENLGRIAGIGGLSLGIFLILFKGLLRKISVPGLTRSQWFKVIMVFMCFVWSIAAIGLVLWFLSSIRSSNYSAIPPLEPLEEGTAYSDFPIITLRPDFNNDENLPYGWLYWNSGEQTLKAIALPFSIKQMHSTLRLFPKTDPNIPDDIPDEVDVSQTTKATYSSVVFNCSPAPVIVENVSLILESHQPLPNRSVAIWHRKGLVRRSVVRLSLSPQKKEQFLFTGKDAVYELAAGESFPFHINIIGGEPGLYTLYVKAVTLVNGKPTTLQSPVIQLAVLHPEKIDNTIQILSIGPSPDLGVELLGLSPQSFQELANRFKGKYPRDYIIRQILDKSYINGNYQNYDWRRYKQYEDAKHAFLKGNLGYIQHIGNNLDIETAKQELNNYLTRHPESEPAREMLVSFLLTQGKKKEAHQIAKDFVAKRPRSYVAHLALWRTEHSTTHLERSISLAPHQKQPYFAAALSHVAENQPLPSNFFTNIKHLPEGDRQKILLDIMKAMYLFNFGLDYDVEDVAFLCRVDTRAKMLFNFLPENISLYRRLLHGALGKSANEVIIEDNSMPLLVDLLISVGRLRLAEFYGRQTSRKYIVKSSGAACNFDALVDITKTTLELTDNRERSARFLNGSSMHDKLTPFEYIVCGLAVIEREKWDLFDKLVDVYASDFPNQTNLLRAAYNQARGQTELAKLQIYVYWIQAFRDVFSMEESENKFDSIEERIIVYQGNLERIFEPFFDRKGNESNNKGNESHHLRSVIHNIFFPSDGNRHTYWPVKYTWSNKFMGYEAGFKAYTMCKYVGLPPDEFFLVRIPNMVMPMKKDNIFEVPPFIGLQLADIRAASKRSKTLFKSGVYGKRLTEDEIQNSYLLHLAWYYYWNEGRIDQAIAYLNKAIASEENYYDALLLRAKLLFTKGDFNAAIQDFNAARDIGPLSELDAKILKRCSQSGS